MAQSTNDTIPTAIRLGALWRVDELLTSLKNLQSSLESKADEFKDVVKSGRTHLQDAVPITLGQEFSAYAKAVERDAERIRRAAYGLRRLGIGGTAVGSGLNAHPEYHAKMVKKLSELTGLELYESDNLFESMQSQADAADFSASMRTLALTLIRIANDFRLLSSGPSTGLDEIRLPAVQPGSSIMPGKVNPVLAEMLNQAMFHVVGCDTTVALAVQAGQLELNVMMPIIAHNLFEMMQVVIGSVNAFSRALCRRSRRVQQARLSRDGRAVELLRRWHRRKPDLRQYRKGRRVSGAVSEMVRGPGRSSARPRPDQRQLSIAERAAVVQGLDSGRTGQVAGT
jgi:fumarate hydratase class II